MVELYYSRSQLFTHDGLQLRFRTRSRFELRINKIRRIMCKGLINIKDYVGLLSTVLYLSCLEVVLRLDRESCLDVSDVGIAVDAVGCHLVAKQRARQGPISC